MKFGKLTPLFLSFFLSCFIQAQNPFLQYGYILPLDIKPLITGTFGELRNNHFHTGIDFATGGQINKNIYCIADGYVSRIKVSPYGYGKVIYVTHQNGLVSVYGHLNEFNIVVDDYVRRKQYENESFEIELFPDQRLFPLKKGDIVGYSGNTGSSTGPHLHFEIRSEISERPVNPFFFYDELKNADKINPLIRQVYVYEIGGNRRKIFDESEKKPADSVIVKENFYIGVFGEDQVNVAAKCGIYQLSIYFDSARVFHLSFDSLSFEQGRYINALIDYEEYVNSKKRIIKTLQPTGSRLDACIQNQNRGLFVPADSSWHHIRIEMADFSGNNDIKNFCIKKVVAAIENTSLNNINKETLYFGLGYRFKTKHIEINIPPAALYDSILFYYSADTNQQKYLSPLHHIHYDNTPLHQPITIKIKPNDGADTALFNKMMVVQLRPYPVFKSSFREGGYICAKISEFGDYAIMADTVPPQIKTKNFNNGKKIKYGDRLSFTIEDKQSGIGSYSLRINNKWVLAEYDAKNDELFYMVDELHFLKGKNELSVSIIDKAGNVAISRLTLLY